MNKYKVYLFDLDGTLVDSEKIKGKALAETCSLFGGEVDVNMYKSVMGERWANVTQHFFDAAKIKPDFEVFNDEFKKIYQKLLFEELAPNPNAVALLDKLKGMGKILGVVSSASGWMVDHILSQLELAHYFDVVIAKEHVRNHKPDPEAYLLAIKKLSVTGSEVLIFEDSNAGLQAAKNANCDVVAFRHHFNASHDFTLAIETISDYNEFPIQL